MDRSEGDETVARTIPTLTVLMAATLFTAAAAHAQSARGAQPPASTPSSGI